MNPKIIKGISRPTSNFLLNCKRLIVFPLRSETRQDSHSQNSYSAWSWKSSPRNQAGKCKPEFEREKVVSIYR